VVELPKKAPSFESAMPARPGKGWSGMPQVTNLPYTCSVLHAIAAAVDEYEQRGAVRETPGEQARGGAGEAT
jgi:hypothetical protein